VTRAGCLRVSIAAAFLASALRESPAGVTVAAASVASMGGAAPFARQGGMQTYDDLLLRVERQAPGFGGMFVGADGRLVVFLLDPATLTKARTAIEAVFGAGQIPQAGIRAIPGRYTVSQLKAWTDRLNALLELPGVTLVDLDDARNCVTVGVDDREVLPRVEAALTASGVPREAIVLQITGGITPVGRQ